MSKNLDRYIEAVKTLRALERAKQDDGKNECGRALSAHPSAGHDFVGLNERCAYSYRAEAIKRSKDDVKILARGLSSREHWLATRTLGAAK